MNQAGGITLSLPFTSAAVLDAVPLSEASCCAAASKPAAALSNHLLRRREVGSSLASGSVT